MRSIKTSSKKNLTSVYFLTTPDFSTLCFSEIHLSFSGNFANNFNLTRFLPGEATLISQFYKYTRVLCFTK